MLTKADREQHVVQDIIDDYDGQGIRMSRPFRKRRSRKEKPEAFQREAADASASESAGYDSNDVDVDTIKQELHSRSHRKGQLSLIIRWKAMTEGNRNCSLSRCCNPCRH